MNEELVISVFLLLLSLLAFFYFFRVYKLASESLTWPMTSGTIRSFKVSSTSDDQSRSWFCSVKYAYKVADIEYVSSRINFSYIFIHSDISLKQIVRLEEN